MIFLSSKLNKARGKTGKNYKMAYEAFSLVLLL
jgi:hypothetical protein